MVKELNFEHKRTQTVLGKVLPSYDLENYKKSKISGLSQAKGKVNYAIKKGILKSLRKNIIPCSYCGYRARYYEHRDYNKPLDVMPVCASCNQNLGNAIHIIL